MIQKRVLVPDRVRRLPKSDWAWVERRFLRDFAPKLSGDAVFLYYILVAVSDKSGLSFYSDNSLAEIIRTSPQQLVQARQELIDWDLIAYQAPLAQVLSIPQAKASITSAAQAVHSAQAHSTQQTQADADSLQQLIALLAAKVSVNSANTSKEARQ
jgi:hypothetical protein